MTLPKDISKAMASIDISCVSGHTQISEDAWQTIRSHMLSQDAEIERRMFVRSREWATLSGENERRADLAESRLAAANALLRDVYGKVVHQLAVVGKLGASDRFTDMDALPRDPVMREVMHIREQMDRLSAHLQGDGNEATVSHESNCPCGSSLCDGKYDEA